MKFVSLILGVGLIAASSLTAQESTQGDYIKLIDPLDEPEFYCFDLTGWRASLALDDPLQAHTCKENGPDQMFAFEGDRIEVVGYDRCLQASGSSGTTLAGATILARECSDTSTLQGFELDAAGKLHIKETGLCVGVGTSSGEASGPSHVWRALVVADCDLDDSLSTWQIGLD
jgi:hypothetical protein